MEVPVAVWSTSFTFPHGLVAEDDRLSLVSHPVAGMTTETENCSASGCWRVAIASLESHPLCRMHFIDSCEAELEAYQQRLRENRLGEVSPESARRFVNQCTQQADNIERGARDLVDSDRERLLNLIALAANLGRYLRRSPRKVTSIAVQVRSEKSGQRWEEKTETQAISRYGASLKCQRYLEIGESIRVERLENGRKADARVAWHLRKQDGQPKVGIEFLNCDNFWELDWTKIN
jgi:PilZ domain